MLTARHSRRSICALQGGAARGEDTPGFAPRLRGCLRRFACFGASDFSLLVVQCSPRYSRRSVWAPQGGAARGEDTPFFAPRLRGCLRRFACFGASGFSRLVVQLSPQHSRRSIFRHPKGVPPGVRTLHSSRPDCGDASGGLPASAPSTSPVWWSNAHRDIAGVAFGHSKGEPPGVGTLHSSRPDCGDVSGGLPVSAPPASFVWWSNAHRET